MIIQDAFLTSDSDKAPAVKRWLLCSRPTDGIFFPSSPRPSIHDSRPRSRLPEGPCCFQSILSFQEKNTDSLLGLLVIAEAVFVDVSLPQRPYEFVPSRCRSPLSMTSFIYFFLSLSEMPFNDISEGKCHVPFNADASIHSWRLVHT